MVGYHVVPGTDHKNPRRQDSNERRSRVLGQDRHDRRCKGVELMRLVVIESPFAAIGDRSIEHHLKYLRAAMHDCLMRGEAPYASHALYTQPGVLDDGKPDERKHGIKAGFAWRCVADATI